jgi:hypothetical protein
VERYGFTFQKVEVDLAGEAELRLEKVKTQRKNQATST